MITKNLTKLKPLANINQTRSFWSELRDKYVDLPKPKNVDYYTKLQFSDLEKLRKQPKQYKTLTREFIHNSLYHPNYGYFSKQALIFSPLKPFEFGKIRDHLEFMNLVAGEYKELEDEVNVIDDVNRQVWHTPTELFKPHYGESIANYLVNKFKKEFKAGENLIIYEIGAGNGTLMMNILDYIKREHPDIYSITRYNIVEISNQLSKKQLESNLLPNQLSHLHHHLNLVNKSILDFDQIVNDKCFVIALEVIDNFSHDVIRYDNQSGDIAQGLVAVDDNGDMEEVYEYVNDPLIKEYLDIRDKVGFRSPLQNLSLADKLKNQLPFSKNLSKPEFLPTMTYKLVKKLKHNFPNHHLIMSDFYELPDTIEGIDAPVIQTRFENTMIPCSTYLVELGYFDIFFPTNFELLRDVYNEVLGTKAGQVVHQKDFLLENGLLENTRTKSGENPMLNYYENNKFLLS
jgi:SAM-dependent MidA family methyltransferase